MDDNEDMKKPSLAFLKNSSAPRNEVRVTASGVAIEKYNIQLVREELQKLARAAKEKKLFETVDTATKRE